MEKRFSINFIAIQVIVNKGNDSKNKKSLPKKKKK